MHVILDLLSSLVGPTNIAVRVAARVTARAIAPLEVSTQFRSARSRNRKRAWHLSQYVVVHIYVYTMFEKNSYAFIYAPAFPHLHMHVMLPLLSSLLGPTTIAVRVAATVTARAIAPLEVSTQFRSVASRVRKRAWTMPRRGQ